MVGLKWLDGCRWLGLNVALVFFSRCSVVISRTSSDVEVCFANLATLHAYLHEKPKALECPERIHGVLVPGF